MSILCTYITGVKTKELLFSPPWFPCIFSALFLCLFSLLNVLLMIPIMITRVLYVIDSHSAHCRAETHKPQNGGHSCPTAQQMKFGHSLLVKPGFQ